VEVQDLPPYCLWDIDAWCRISRGLELYRVNYKNLCTHNHRLYFDWINYMFLWHADWATHPHNHSLHGLLRFCTTVRDSDTLGNFAWEAQVCAWVTCSRPWRSPWPRQLQEFASSYLTHLWAWNQLTQTKQLVMISLVPRPFMLPVFDCLQYAKMEREGLGNFITWSTARLTSQILDATAYSHLYPHLQRS